MIRASNIDCLLATTDNKRPRADHHLKLVEEFCNLRSIKYSYIQHLVCATSALDLCRTTHRMKTDLSTVASNIWLFRCRVRRTRKCVKVCATLLTSSRRKSCSSSKSRLTCCQLYRNAPSTSNKDVTK